MKFIEILSRNEVKFSFAMQYEIPCYIAGVILFWEILLLVLNTTSESDGFERDGYYK